MILGKKLYSIIAGTAIVGGGIVAYAYFGRGSETTSDSLQTTATFKKLKSFKGMSDKEIDNTKKFFKDLRKNETDNSFLSQF